MEIYGTPTSPYTRIARIVAYELGFSLPLRELSWREDAGTLFEANPAGRIPLLVDGDLRIGESRVICNYLMEHDGAAQSESFRPLRGASRWDEEGLLNTLYGAIDSFAVIRFFGDPSGESHSYFARSRERIDQCFLAIDQIAARHYLVDPDHFGMAEAALITAVDAIEGRKVADLGEYKNVGAIRTRFMDRESILETVADF